MLDEPDSSAVIVTMKQAVTLEPGFELYLLHRIQPVLVAVWAVGPGGGGVHSPGIKGFNHDTNAVLLKLLFYEKDS